MGVVVKIGTDYKTVAFANVDDNCGIFVLK